MSLIAAALVLTPTLALAVHLVLLLRERVHPAAPGEATPLLNPSVVLAAGVGVLAVGLATARVDEGSWPPGSDVRFLAIVAIGVAWGWWAVWARLVTRPRRAAWGVVIAAAAALAGVALGVAGAP